MVKETLRRALLFLSASIIVISIVLTLSTTLSITGHALTDVENSGLSYLGIAMATGALIFALYSLTIKTA